jgi:hypothetical protein
LERLIYRSRALAPEPSAALGDILAASIWNNARHGITGALGFSGGAYVQLLEGRAEALDGLLAKLAADPRHTDMAVLFREPVGTRLLSGWSMARVDLAEVAPQAGAALATGDGLALTGLLVNLVHTRSSALA